MSQEQDHAYQEAVDVESALLRGVIDLRADLDTASHLSSLDPEAFMDSSHRIIWRAFQVVTAGGGVLDSWVTSKAVRKLGGNQQDVNEVEILFATPGLGTSDLRPRVAKVADHFKRRLIARSMASLAERAVTDPLPEIAEAFAEVGAKVAQAGNPRMKAATDYARQFEAYLSGRPILPMESCQNLMVCGIPGLDESIVANPGRLIVFGGLPSAGKTALAVQVAVRTVQAGRRVALGSLEMDEDEISARIVACACGVNSLQALRHGVRSVAPEDRGILEGVRKGIVGLHGCAGDSWTSIEAAIAREHRRAPLSLAIVDYLQLLGEPDVKAKRASDTEAQRIGEITKASKRLAQRLGINVLILSQFNRNVAECEEPSLQHFLGSGQIERDIDIAVLLWNTVKNPEPGADRIVMGRIAKNRGGQRYGKVRMRFNPAHNQFTEEAQQTEGGFSAPLVRYTESPLPIGG